jgi:Ferritin-like
MTKSWLTFPLGDAPDRAEYVLSLGSLNIRLLKELSMKSIAQFVQDEISTLSDLKDALQTAMQLEFATIPPYLCAQWSINNDPGGVGGMIENIVVQEMFHLPWRAIC